MISSKPFLSTFGKKLIKREGSNHVNLSEQGKNKHYYYPAGLVIQNNTPYKIKIDSLLVKCSSIDTHQAQLYANVFQQQQRIQLTPLLIGNQADTVKTFYADSTLLLPKGLSYLGFSFEGTGEFTIDFYCTFKKSTIGVLYIYKEWEDEFKDVVADIKTSEKYKVSTPQVKIYYSKMIAD
jgi:hypothetical protein